jgi:hypothetical protein
MQTKHYIHGLASVSHPFAAPALPDGNGRQPQCGTPSCCFVAGGGTPRLSDLRHLAYLIYDTPLI